jgi:hypothetical protein
MARKRKRGYCPPKIREDVVNRLVELYKRDHPAEFRTVTNAPPKGYSSPKPNRNEVEKLKKLYHRDHPEEFPNRRKSLPKSTR